MSQIDSAKASIGIYTYDCFNDPAAPNRCDGTRNGELEKPDTNWFFIACCIVLGLICVSLIVSVLCYTKKPARPAFYTDEGAGADSTGAGAPLVGNGVGRTAADHDGDSDAEANFL